MFKVKIITPDRQYDDFDASILNVVTVSGQIGLLTNHMPYISQLLPSKINYVNEVGERKYLDIGTGFISFVDNLATVVIDYCHEN